MKWTEDEITYLTNNWSDKTKRPAVIEQLGRSKAACAAKYRKVMKETTSEEVKEDVYIYEETPKNWPTKTKIDSPVVLALLVGATIIIWWGYSQ